MVFDEELHNDDAKKYLKNNKLNPVLEIALNEKNDDLIVTLEEPLNMIDLFRGLAKLMHILSYITKKDTDTLIEILKKAVDLEKLNNKK
jgi:hypothetical protein